MGELCTSLAEFAKGVLSRSYFWLAALLTDPLDWWNRYLKPTGWPDYDVSPATFFYVLGVLVLWTSFLTYHDLRRSPSSREREPNMPLHEACRWIAAESAWAARYKAPDDEWPEHVARELFTKWQLGKIEMIGMDREGNGGLGYRPPAMKGTATFEIHKLSLQRAADTCLERRGSR